MPSPSLTPLLPHDPLDLMMRELPKWSIYCSVQVAPKAAFDQPGCGVDGPMCTAHLTSAEAGVWPILDSTYAVTKSFRLCH